MNIRTLLSIFSKFDDLGTMFILLRTLLYGKNSKTQKECSTAQIERKYFFTPWKRMNNPTLIYMIALSHFFWFTRESYYFRHMRNEKWRKRNRMNHQQSKKRYLNIWDLHHLFVFTCEPYSCEYEVIKKRVLFVWGFVLCCVLFVCVCLFWGVRC